MQQTNRGQVTIVAWYACHEATTVSWPLLVHCRLNRIFWGQLSVRMRGPVLVFPVHMWAPPFLAAPPPLPWGPPGPCGRQRERIYQWFACPGPRAAAWDTNCVLSYYLLGGRPLGGGEPGTPVPGLNHKQGSFAFARPSLSLLCTFYRPPGLELCERSGNRPDPSRLMQQHKSGWWADNNSNISSRGCIVLNRWDCADLIQLRICICSRKCCRHAKCQKFT